MINSYTITAQDIDINENLIFAVNKVLTGCTVTHTAGTDSFKLNKPGYYYVAFDGSASTIGTAGNVTVELFSNGAAVPGALTSTYSAAAVNVGSLGFSTIVRVLPSCNCVDNSVTLTLQNTGVEATYTNVNLTITKLC